MSSRVFENMLCAPHPNPQKWWEANKGTLTVTETGIDFRGKRPLTIPRQCDIPHDHHKLART